MSLFQLKEFWSSPIGVDIKGYKEDEPYYDTGSICVGDFCADGRQLIAVGSLQGILRIFAPEPGGYNAEHQLLEFQLSLPIIQLAFGHFLGEEYGMILLILTPKQLVYASVKPSPDGEKFLILQRVQQVPLKYFSLNMIVDKFGAANVTCACVQSLKGVLTFIKAGTVMFSRAMPNALMPGPLCYIESHDYILLTNSSMEVHAYRFKDLVEVKLTDSEDVFDEDLVETDIQPVWKCVVGEIVLDMQLAYYFSPAEQSILVLAERTLLALNPKNGQVKYERALDSPIAVMHVYSPSRSASDINRKQHVMLASTSKLISILDSERLLWAAYAEEMPVACRVVKLSGRAGLIMTCDARGKVAANYLGTDISKLKVTPSSLDIIDSASIDRTFQATKEKIDEALKASSNLTSFDVLKFTAEVAKVKDEFERIVVSLNVVIHNLSSNSLENVEFDVSGAINVEIEGSQTVAPKATSTLVVRARFEALRYPRLSVSCVAETSAGIYAVSQTDSYISPHWFYVQVEPREVDPKSVIVLELRADLARIEAYIASMQLRITDNCIWLQCKNSQKYVMLELASVLLVKSDKLSAALPFLINLHKYLNKSQTSHEYVSLLPFEFFFLTLDQYQERRLAIGMLEQSFDRLSQQYRTVQKRLYLRLREKQPGHIDHLMILLDEAYSRAMAVVTKLEKEKSTFETMEHDLFDEAVLICLLAKIQFNLTDSQFESLVGIFTSPFNYSYPAATGWLESVGLAVCQLLRTNFAKSDKDATGKLLIPKFKFLYLRLKFHRILQRSRNIFCYCSIALRKPQNGLTNKAVFIVLMEEIQSPDSNTAVESGQSSNSPLVEIANPQGEKTDDIREMVMPELDVTLDTDGKKPLFSRKVATPEPETSEGFTFVRNPNAEHDATDLFQIAATQEEKAILTLDEQNLPRVSSPTAEKQQAIINRNDVIEEIKKLLAEYDKEQAVHEDLEGKLAEFLIKKERNEDKLDEAEVQEEALQSKENRYIATLAEIKTAQADISDASVSKTKAKIDLTAKFDSIWEELQKIKKNTLKYRKKQASLGISAKTAKPIDMAAWELIENTRSKKEEELYGIQVDAILHRNKLARWEEVLNKKEELAEGLHLMDFEQLKIEAQTFLEKIEERDKEMFKLRQKVMTTGQIITHVMEKIDHIQRGSIKLKSTLAELDETVIQVKNKLPDMKRSREILRKKNLEVKHKAGFLVHPELLFDFEKSIDSVKQLEEELFKTKKTYETLVKATDKRSALS